MTSTTQIEPVITIIKGNLLDAPVEALVNTVNTVGIMGKGIALQFKERFPPNYVVYSKAVEKNSVRIGKMFITEVHQAEAYQKDLKYIVNFPTKKHWRNRSQMEYIEAGLKDLKEFLIENNVRSVAIPPLGSGNGGLAWVEVQSLIRRELKDIETKIYLYEPTEQIEIQVSVKENRNIRLTKVRAMLLLLLRKYLAMFEPPNLFAAVKLCYFLQRFGQPNMKLKFESGHYGPYDDNVRHVVYHLNGKYIKGYSSNESKPFIPFELNSDFYDEVDDFIKQELDAEEAERLQTVCSFLVGFETAYSLELLSTVDMIIQNHNTIDPEVIIGHMGNWNLRKSKMFGEERFVKLAVNHLVEYGLAEQNVSL